MAETSGKKLKCVVVTPERELLDVEADFVVLPMFDGELGVLPGRAPLVGRLGAGELRIRQGTETRRYFVDTGFAQVRSNVVTVLTSRALPASEINVAKAKEDLQQAVKEMASTPEAQKDREKAQERARAQIRTAERAGKT